MIKLNTSNVIDGIVLDKYEPIVRKIANEMERHESVGFEWLGWKDLPINYNKVEFEEIKNEAKRLISEGVETLVVVGIGGSFAGAKAAIEMIHGEFPEKRAMEVIFLGESLSSTNIAQKLKYLEKRNFAINVVSKSGTTTEPAVAFRLVKKLLEEKVGVNNAAKFIIATTDANKGTLLKMSKHYGYKTFAISDNIGGRFSVLSPVGLFPMACAGLDLDEIMAGAAKAWERYSVPELSRNDAYRYAVARDFLSKKLPVELMVQYEPQMKAFNEWWKQLAGESEGKQEKGVFPASAIFTTDLHSLGQFIQDGTKMLFETVMVVEEPTFDVRIINDDDNLDNLNYLKEKTIHEINRIAMRATADAHMSVGKVPNILIEYTALNEFTFGELTVFFMRAIAMTAYLQGSNPFNQPGVEVYKANMFKLLGKP